MVLPLLICLFLKEGLDEVEQAVKKNHFLCLVHPPLYSILLLASPVIMPLPFAQAPPVCKGYGQQKNIRSKI